MQMVEGAAKKKGGAGRGTCGFCGEVSPHLYYGYCDSCSHERWKRWLGWQNRIIKKFDAGQSWRITRLERPLYEMAEAIERLNARLGEARDSETRERLAGEISGSWGPIEELIQRYNREGYEVYSVLLGDKKMAFRVRRPPKR